MFIKIPLFCLILSEVIELMSCSTLDLYKNARLGTRTVQTRYGRLQGLILPLDNYKFLRPIEAFLGVPYATPPTKSNRFSPTRAPSPWDGVRISDKFSPVCPQRLPNILNETAALEKMPRGRLEYLKRLLPFLQNQSEDCLYLNVFIPVHVSNSPDKKLPVLIFLHGESFEWNSGNPYDGTVLSSYGDLVVVTLNYRLGILGFLNANPSPQIRARVANYGLMDQMAALQWVQENIAKFGGNPNMVTLAGHGSGAACINFLMTSPTMVSGLFHRTILLSGSAYSSWALVDDPVVYALKLAKEVNCSIPEDLIKHHEQIVDCLRDIPLDELLAADIQAPNFLSAFGPSVDGVVIKTSLTSQDPDEPIHGTSKRSQDASGRYDLLFGVVTGEAVWRFNSPDVINGFEGERRDKIIRTYVRNAYTYHLSEIFYTVVNEYTDWERTSSHPINTRDAAIAALSDAQYVAPLVHTGDMLAPPPAQPGQEKTGPKCFFYVFDYQTKDGDYPQKLGTVHGEDLPYIFGAPLVDGFSHFPRNYSKSEVALSESLMLYWSNFARSGNPNEHHRQDTALAASKERNRFRTITWDEYDPVHQKYLEIGMKPRMKNHFRAHQLSIWLRLIPELHRAGMEDVIARHNLFKNHDDMELYDGPVKPDAISKLSMFDDAFRRRGNSTELSSLNGITTVEPSLLTTCIPVSNYTAAASSGIIPTAHTNSSIDTMTGVEAGYAAYSTALSVTIAIGCSLLILNVLIFAGVYYQRDKTRLEVKSLQKQYQQHSGNQPGGPFDPMKHGHYPMGHSQSANIIVDIENHDTGTLLLANEVKGPPHICSNSIQMNTGTCKIPLGTDSVTYPTKIRNDPMMGTIPIKTQTLNRNNSTFGGGGGGVSTTGNGGGGNIMTLPKQHPMGYNRNECMTLPRNLNSSNLTADTQPNKLQPNGGIGMHHLRTQKPSGSVRPTSPPQNTLLLTVSQNPHYHHHHQQLQQQQNQMLQQPDNVNGNQTTFNLKQNQVHTQGPQSHQHQSQQQQQQQQQHQHQQQFPQAAMDEMRV